MPFLHVLQTVLHCLSFHLTEAQYNHRSSIMCIFMFTSQKFNHVYFYVYLTSQKLNHVYFYVYMYSRYCTHLFECTCT